MKKNECIKDINVLHKTQINDQLMVYIGQQVYHKHEDVFGRSQYMAIVIHDEKNDQHIRLRMSSMRKIFKWIKKKHWDKARRLKWWEKITLCKQAKDVYEDMIPNYERKAKEKRDKRKREAREQRRLVYLERLRREFNADLNAYHRLTDEDYHGIIGKKLKEKINKAEREIERLKGEVAESG